jgi:hypothetical protein
MTLPRLSTAQNRVQEAPLSAPAAAGIFRGLTGGMG